MILEVFFSLHDSMILAGGSFIVWVFFLCIGFLLLLFCLGFFFALLCLLFVLAKHSNVKTKVTEQLLQCVTIRKLLFVLSVRIKFICWKYPKNYYLPLQSANWTSWRPQTPAFCCRALQISLVLSATYIQDISRYPRRFSPSSFNKIPNSNLNVWFKAFRKLIYLCVWKTIFTTVPHSSLYFFFSHNHERVGSYLFFFSSCPSCFFPSCNTVAIY